MLLLSLLLRPASRPALGTASSSSAAAASPTTSPGLRGAAAAVAAAAITAMTTASAVVAAAAVHTARSKDRHLLLVLQWRPPSWCRSQQLEHILLLLPVVHGTTGFTKQVAAQPPLVSAYVGRAVAAAAATGDAY